MAEPVQPSKVQAALYRFHIQGHLGPHWSAWFDDMQVTPNADGTTTLEGVVVDQAALYGLIGRLRDLGITLLAVQQLAGENQSASTKVVVVRP